MVFRHPCVLRGGTCEPLAARIVDLALGVASNACLVVPRVLAITANALIEVMSRQCRHCLIPRRLTELPPVGIAMDGRVLLDSGAAGTANDRAVNLHSGVEAFTAGALGRKPQVAPDVRHKEQEQSRTGA